MSRVRRTIAALWFSRRWLFGAYMAVALARIPARTGFRLIEPACDMRLTLTNAALSLTKVPHVILFGIFFLLTAIQFDRLDRRTLAWSLAATVALGFVVEIEEGATRTGNCRITDVLPDAWGALIGMALLMAVTMLYRQLVRVRIEGT